MDSPSPPPSAALRWLFALEGVAWLALLVLDLATVRAQLEIAALIPMTVMPAWIALSALLCVALIASSAAGVRAGRGVLSRRIAGPLGTLVLVFGVGLRAILWMGVMGWLTTMSGLQSV